LRSLKDFPEAQVQYLIAIAKKPDTKDSQPSAILSPGSEVSVEVNVNPTLGITSAPIPSAMNNGGEISPAVPVAVTSNSNQQTYTYLTLTMPPVPNLPSPPRDLAEEQTPQVTAAPATTAAVGGAITFHLDTPTSSP
jgi:hypothetical protein